VRMWAALTLLGCGSEPLVPCAAGTARIASGECVPVRGTSDLAPDTAVPAPDTAVLDDTGVEPVRGPTTIPLAGPRLLRRISLDLIGTLPEESDLNAVEADLAALDPIIERYLEDAPRLESRLVAILGETWHTQVDAFLFQYLEYPSLRLDPAIEFPFERSAGEEPLRLMAHIGARDLPWTNILTANFTVANELLESIWPLERRGDGPAWTLAQYTDGRPAAGVLATNGMWLRYYSSRTNQNRGRAAAISRLLICEDFLTRPVSFADFPVLADVDGTEKAIKEEPYCVGCHSAIDPIAATLFGFWAIDTQNGTETTWYHAERELMGPEILQVEPHWFGIPVRGLAELSHQIAADPRFRSCTAQTMARGLWRRPIELADFDVLAGLRQDFEAGDLRLRVLIHAVLQTEAYQAGQMTAEATEEEVEQARMAHLLMPDQLHSAVKELTGFSWWYNGFDQMANDTYGFRIMAGGVNGYHVTQPQADPSVTHAIVVQRLAEAGADAVVSHDLIHGAEPRRLFEGLSLEDRPGDAVFDGMLRTLSWRLLARRPTEAQTEDLADLWRDVESASDAATAWTAVLSALLRDPEFVSY